MSWLNTTARVIGWACLLAWLVIGWACALAWFGGVVGAWDFHVCLKSPAGACSKAGGR